MFDDLKKRIRLNPKATKVIGTILGMIIGLIVSGVFESATAEEENGEVHSIS